MPLESIRTLVIADLEAIDQCILRTLASDIPLINQIINYILQCGGKRIRPLVTLLCAHATRPNPQQGIELATAIELIHTATLLHDDVVDQANLRRNKPTANALWGNQASVLVGDFLYSRAFQFIIRLQHAPILHTFSDATHLIAEGEVLQLLHARKTDLSEKDYFDVITRKTAKLFEVAAKTGAALSSDDPIYLNAMQQYGLHIGLAYQLIDDVLDYNASTEEIGKTIGNDLVEGKMTLPLIHALRQTSFDETALLQKAIKTGDPLLLEPILKIIESTESIAYTANLAKQHIKRACEELTRIPGSPYRDALYKLAEFVIERRN